MAQVEIITVPGTAWKYLADGSLCAADNAWTLGGFSDAAWTDSSATGNGLFGIESAATPLPINTPLPAQAAGARTDYFRTKFNWTGATAGVVVYGTNYIDDGIIIYLNGTEVFRQNMGDAATINYAMGTLDCNFDPGNAVGDGAALQMNFSVPNGLLVVGENTMAVELHQAGGNSSDKMFGLWLFADETSAPMITTQPVGADVNEKDSYTLTVVATGLPLPTYQWFQGGVEIVGATGASYTIASMGSVDAGDYTVRVTNSQGEVTSDPAQINFVPDTEPPFIVDGVIIDANTIVMTWNEDMDETTIDNISIGVFNSPCAEQPAGFCDVFDPEANLVASIYYVTNGNQVVWITARAMEPDQDYIAFWDAFSIADTAETANFIEDPIEFPLGRQFLVTLSEFTDNWFYDQTQHHTNPSASEYITDGSWKNPGFDAAANGWPSGPGMFGTEANRPEIQTPWVTTSAGGPFTVYAVTTFVLDGALSDVRELRLNSRYDDGCIVYLNGVEVLRKGIGATVVPTYQTTAASHESDTVDSDVLTGFVAGVNTIAVEVHQTGEGSSDIVWGAEIVANLKSLPTGPINIITQPQAQTVDEGASVTFSVTATGGAPITYQWRRNTTPIDGATGSSYTDSFVTRDDAGTYDVVLTNPVETETSAGALLTVNQDNVGPVLQTGEVRESGEIALSFDEIVDAMVLNLASISIYPTGGDPVAGNLGVASGVVEGGSTWVLTTTTEPTSGVNYSVRLLAGAVADRFGNGNLATTQGLAIGVTVFDFAGEWKFYEAGDIDAQAWKDLGYDDASWGGGPGILGTEPDLTPSTNPDLPSIQTAFLSGSLGGPQLTTYLRKKFTLPAPLASVQSLSIDYIFDDGVVVFLNGTEVIRRGVAAGETFATAGTSHEANVVDTDTIPVSALVEGENILAVRVHDQNATSSDRVWGAQLKAIVGEITSEAPTVSDPLPANQTVNEGDTVVYSVVVTGFPTPSVQWRLNGVDIPGANSTALTLTAVDCNDQGAYTVFVSNLEGSDTSAAANLTVTPETVPPTVVSASGEIDKTKVILVFSEEVNEASAETTSNYTIAPQGGGAALTVVGATLVSPTRVELTTSTPRVAGTFYAVSVSGVTDEGCSNNPIVPVTINIDVEGLMGRNQVWSYEESNVAPPADWNTVGFVDAAWPTGPAPLGFETLDSMEADLAANGTLLQRFFEGAATQTTTYYFRTHFNFTGTAGDVGLQLVTEIDDGAIFYLNGTEILALGVDSGAGHTDQATRTVGDATDAETINLPSTGLVNGDNVLAVEVHQSGTASSDVWMATVLNIIQPVVTVTVAREANGDLTITWNATAGFILHEADAVEGPYTPVAGNPSGGTYTVTAAQIAADGQKFYAVIRP